MLQYLCDQVLLKSNPLAEIDEYCASFGWPNRRDTGRREGRSFEEVQMHFAKHIDKKR